MLLTLGLAILFFATAMWILSSSHKIKVKRDKFVSSIVAACLLFGAGEFFRPIALQLFFDNTTPIVMVTSVTPKEVTLASGESFKVTMGYSRRENCDIDIEYILEKTMANGSIVSQPIESRKGNWAEGENLSGTSVVHIPEGWPTGIYDFYVKVKGTCEGTRPNLILRAQSGVTKVTVIEN